MITFKWLFEIANKTNSVYVKLINSSSLFKIFSHFFKFSIIIGIIAVLILKYWKISQLKSNEIKPNENNDDNDHEDKLDNLINDYDNSIKNIIQSEERWRMQENFKNL